MGTGSRTGSMPVLTGGTHQDPKKYLRDPEPPLHHYNKPLKRLTNTIPVEI